MQSLKYSKMQAAGYKYSDSGQKGESIKENILTKDKNENQSKKRKKRRKEV